ncbi:TIGR00270 family protein [Candidatus Woesearchaeota archaeon]|nr:TIGR00270 family protein [Candidatus Woesearchaeota archaeon]
MIKINCDLCGKANENLNRAIIEGVELEVCNDCSKFGKVIAHVKRPSVKEQAKLIRKKTLQDNEEKIELLVEGYSDLIKKRREAMGLTQKDFASKINEKESTIHHIETGSFEPPLNLAKKLERFLGVKLVEEHEEKHEPVKMGKEIGFTLGDFINIKK